MTLIAILINIIAFILVLFCAALVFIIALSDDKICAECVAIGKEIIEEVNSEPKTMLIIICSVFVGSSLWLIFG